MTNPLTDEVIDKAVDAYERCYLGFDLETREKMRAPDTECMRAAAKVIESAVAEDRRDAERYRKLRACRINPYAVLPVGEKLDDYIAAIKGKSHE